MAAAIRRHGLRVVGEEGPVSPYPKCSLVLRGCARALDTLIAVGLYLLFSKTGAVVPLLFILFADGLLQGQSLGKRLFGIRAVYVPTRTGARHRDSVLRNAPVALIVLLSMMPAPLGRPAFIGGALIIGGIECWKVLRHPLGLRLGDVWAQTQGVDAKVVLGGRGAARSTPTPVGTPAPDRSRSGEQPLSGRSSKETPRCELR
jgi:hypothetical protein